jgi:subtilisin family serine protease
VSEASRWAPLIAEGLTPPAIARDAAGRGLTVAVVDTGVNFSHPHLACRGRAVAVAWDDGELAVDLDRVGDRFGHGTCVAALLHRLAPEVELVSVRVTAERAATDVERLARGIRVALEHGAHVISVSLGTRSALSASLHAAVREVVAAGALLVAADPGEAVLPASSPGALAIGRRDGVDLVREGARLLADGRARPAPGHPKNFEGPSLSTARAAAALARLAESTGARGPSLAEALSRALGLV